MHFDITVTLTIVCFYLWLLYTQNSVRFCFIFQLVPNFACLHSMFPLSVRTLKFMVFFLLFAFSISLNSHLLFFEWDFSLCNAHFRPLTNHSHSFTHTIIYISLHLSHDFCVCVCVQTLIIWWFLFYNLSQMFWHTRACIFVYFVKNYK